jgi:hypothetical protein
VVVHWFKLVAAAMFALALVPSSLSQQPQTLAPEPAAAIAFAEAVRAEGGPHLKRIYKKHVQDLCTADARRWGDGVMGYYRVTFVNEQELTPKMLALIRQLKSTGSQNPAFDATDFARLRRYAVASCGAVGDQTKVVVAVYLSGWDTYWANWANLLGK